MLLSSSLVIDAPCWQEAFLDSTSSLGRAVTVAHLLIIKFLFSSFATTPVRCLSTFIRLNQSWGCG